MPFCPKCKAEYKEGVQICKDCNEKLVETFDTVSEKSEAVSIHPIRVAENVGQLDGDSILALLEDSGIPAFAKELGSGSYMRLYMGFSIYGKDIYVAEKDIQKAKEIIDGYFVEASKEDLENALEYEFEEPVEKETNNAKSLARAIIVSIVVICIAVVTVIGALS